MELDSESANTPKEQQQHFHVLAVDDSLIHRKLLEKLLTFSSYKVTCVDSGDKALEYLGLLEHDQDNNSSSSSYYPSPCTQQQSQQEVSKVNLIMTDYCMPGMSGYDLLKRVKESSWKNIPVVVMSSENVPSRISMCLESGAEEFLLKPLQMSDLKKLHSYLLKSPENSWTDGSPCCNESSKDNNGSVSKRMAASSTETKGLLTKGLKLKA